MNNGKDLKNTDAIWDDKLLEPNRALNPRHRRLAQLAAMGKKNIEIAATLGYSESRVSVLLNNSLIQAEIRRIEDRAFEDDIGPRLRSLAEPAMNVLVECLLDRTGRYKENQKTDVARWLIEKLDGKPMQKHEVGENMLSVLMDRLDMIKATQGRDALDVTPRDSQVVSNPTDEVLSEEDQLKKWVEENLS